MTTWNAARAALDTKMAALAVTTAWPGRSFTPPTTGNWYKPILIPTGTDTEVGSGAVNRPRGTYQVSIFMPSSGNPCLGPLLSAADAVVAHFDRAALSGVQCGVPTLGPVIQEPDWLHLPVSIPFVCP
jgi:hypothetical protein